MTEEGKTTASAIWSFVLAIIVLIVLLSAIVLPARPRKTSSLNACINNLRQIEAAKDQYGLDRELTNGANCTTDGIRDDVAVFSNLVGGRYIRQWPLCPASTSEPADISAMAALSAYDYTPNCIGSNPVCNHQGDSGVHPHSHALPTSK